MKNLIKHTGGEIKFLTMKESLKTLCRPYRNAYNIYKYFNAIFDYGEYHIC